MSRQTSRLPQHVSSVPAMEIDVPSRAVSRSEQHQQQHQQETGLSQRQQQLLKLKQQHEQLQFLEEQLRLSSMIDDAPSRGGSSSFSSGSERSSTINSINSTIQRKSSSASRSRSSSNSSSRRKSSSGGVGFCGDVFCYANPRDFDEIVSSWYSKDELAVFKGERKDLIRELKRVNFDLDQIDRNLFHLRGLEPYLSVKYNKYMQKKRTGVLNTVMSEQQTQRSRGVALKDYSEALRVACCEASAWARERAADLGRRDAKAVGHEPVVSTTTASKRQTSWGHESDISATPSMCSSTVSGSISTHSSLSISSEASMDSIRLRSPSMHKTAQRVVTLARVDELPSLPYSPASSSSSS